MGNETGGRLAHRPHGSAPNIGGGLHIGPCPTTFTHSTCMHPLEISNSCKIQTYIWETKLEGGLHIGPMGLLQSGGLHIGPSPTTYSTCMHPLEISNSCKIITYIWETKLEGGLHDGPMSLLLRAWRPAHRPTTYTALACTLACTLSKFQTHVKS
jgi:hypothetical protein